MHRGLLKFYAGSGKGYGFIIPDLPSLREQFFHIRDVVRPNDSDQAEVEALLEPGTKVEFEIGKGPDGRDRAVRVNLLDVAIVEDD
jgi:cold shock CspA family protein